MDEELRIEITAAAMKAAEDICGPGEEVAPLRSLVAAGFLQGVIFGVTKGSEMFSGAVAKRTIELLKELEEKKEE